MHELLLAAAAAVAAVTVIVVALVRVFRFLRRMFAALERVDAVINKQLTPNSGSAMVDKVDRLAIDVAEVKGDVKRLDSWRSDHEQTTAQAFGRIENLERRPWWPFRR